MKITSNLLSQWQDRAMEGILAALAPRTRSVQEQKPRLPVKVEKLLARKTSSEPSNRLIRRLAALQQEKEPEKGAIASGAK
jgi:hypothetical protein